MHAIYPHEPTTPHTKHITPYNLHATLPHVHKVATQCNDTTLSDAPLWMCGRLDNLVVNSQEPGHVLAVLDWELSTLGDPLADLAYACLPYHLPMVRPACCWETLGKYAMGLTQDLI